MGVTVIFGGTGGPLARRLADGRRAQIDESDPPPGDTGIKPVLASKNCNIDLLSLV